MLLTGTPFFFEDFTVRPLTFFAFAFVVAILLSPFGCHPTMPEPVSPIPVREIDLVSSYRDDHARAGLAYDGQVIRVLVHAFAVVGDNMEVPIVGGKPASIIFHFQGPVPMPKVPCWIQGRCLGRTDDGKDRLLAGFTFHIDVVDCVLTTTP